MLNSRIFSSYLGLLILLLCFIGSCRAKNNSLCITSSCGNINISYPFRLRGDPANCGHPDSIFALECQKNQLILHTEAKRYQVQAITYSNFSIRISDPGLDSHNYSSCPIYSYVDYFSLSYMYLDYTNCFYFTFINCLSPVANSLYVENALCGNKSAFSNSTRVYSYVTARSILVSDLEESCTFDNAALASSLAPWPWRDHNYSYAQIHDHLAYGFEMLWYPALCKECDESKGTCSFEDNNIRCRHYCYEDTPLDERTFFCKLEYYAGYLYISALAIGAIIGLRFILGISCLIGVVVNERRRSRSPTNESENVEELLRFQQNNMPINYSYREIKRMTRDFKAILGRGPHGTVSRGILRSGPLVAVKMLTDSSASDKEFIRHASAISRITNANVVKLFGLCIQGTKRALVSEFVQCGSLDKYIFLHEGKKPSLSCKEMFKISVGIARGIQCLHGANIFHLAIKPQNILLDEDFNAKISDSGLASLYSSHDHRMEAMKANKGKMGFMPPEVLYKNIGDISCKADVYSFGMLVLEMAAQLQSLNPSKRGQVYFPSLIYNQLCEGKGLEIREGEAEEEREMVKKMVVVALWCIQIRPGDRPMIAQVIGMLEGGIELLHMPPMPFQRPMDQED